MNENAVGSFLCALRKANGYTQQEVADRLGVSNKTVSKWERGDGLPEIMMLPALSELYEVSIDEILKGERINRVKNPEVLNFGVCFLQQYNIVLFTFFSHVFGPD